MNRILLSGLLFVLCASFAEAQQSAAEDIDWDRARQLYQQERRGESLSAEDQAYLDRAKKLRREGRPAGERRAQPGARQRPAPERLIPLSDMTADDVYEGEEGGLYGDGKNRPTGDLLKAAETRLAEIRPLDAEGNPADEGKIVFVSISMSNATQEFSRFKQIADHHPDKSTNVIIVDCAQGGQAMAQWAPADARPWETAMARLKNIGVTPEQVQVAWVKLANKSPTGTLEEHGRKLETDTLKVLQNAKAKFPNLKIAYLGSRIWAGNAKGNLNPEPYAYESAFVVRWMIQRQQNGEEEFSLDSIPLLLWGPYLWAEGERGRKSDDLAYLPEDFAGDGVHPSQSGRQKVAGQLLKFVIEDPLANAWFVGD